ncbi:MAG TPA: alpha/beta fold hydrolase [Actinomycetota bacterium]|nr:alpha/beta fold hydrolase [Actinomycetota bacterium]
MPHRRRAHRRWRGRNPALRWDLQKLALRARGDRDAYDVAHSQFWCDSADGVRLAGTRLGQDRDTAIVIAHGFMAYRTKPRWRVLAEGLAARFTVYTFDMRGHGQSAGACTGGEKEVNDVHAVVSYARSRGHERVVTIGGSLGGIAVIGEAAAHHDVDAMIAISSPAEWATSDSKMVRRMTWVFTSTLGRALARRVMGTRINLEWGNPLPPAELIGRIAPIPVLIIHGADDHFFPATDAELLFARAGEPKRLLILPQFGHAEDGFTPAFVEQLAGEAETLVAAAPSH